MLPALVIGLGLVALVARRDWNPLLPNNPAVPPAVKRIEQPAPNFVIQGIHGRVRLQGSPPPEQLLKLDPACAILYSTPPTTRFFVVGNQGELADVFVYIKSGLEGQSFAVPAQPVVLTTARCLYEPYILGVQTRQRLLVKNAGPILHNIHAQPSANGNREANKAQLPNIDLEFVFEQRDVFVRFKTDLYPWMYAYVGVVEHPYFAVTDQAGNFALTNVPPGKYLIAAVHRKAGTLTREVTLGQDEGQTADFVFEFKAQP